MSGALIALIVVVVIVLIVVFWYISTRNGIIDFRNRVDESWSGIDVQLKRRHDLVPNLVETVKGYATHESAVFEKVTQARADAMSTPDTNVAGTAKAEGQLDRALADLRAVAEVDQITAEIRRQITVTQNQRDESPPESSGG